jgi:hypothetical protein
MAVFGRLVSLNQQPGFAFYGLSIQIGHLFFSYCYSLILIQIQIQIQRRKF